MASDGRLPMLKHFMVYNPTFDKSESTEHEKLLYFWPPDVPQDTKMKTVGLVEATVQYTSTFSDLPCEMIRTQKARQAVFKAEENCWLCMGVQLPYSQRAGKDGGAAVTEYHDEDVQDIVLQSLIQQAYKMYKLFNGTFNHILDRGSREALVHKLELFFPQYLQSIKLERADLVDAFDGIQFLPLDKNTYLRVQCFINLAEATFPSIKYSVFMYNDHVVWSGLEQDDMRILYKYLTGGLLHMSSAGTDPAAAAEQGAGGLTNAFVTGPEDLSDPDSPINAPRVFVSLVDESEELHLIIYQAGGVKMCWLVEGSSVMDLEFYKKLHTFVGANAVDIDALIRVQQKKRAESAVEIQYKYLYFNHMNLAQKSSFMTLPKNAGAPVVSSLAPEYVRYLTDVHSDFADTSEDSEVILKTRGDWWVVGRKSDQREFFVILNQKNANLIDINDEIRRLSATHFGNIFFID